MELVQWQIRSQKNNLVMCWFTHPCLEWMERQDWNDKTILMFGAGLGDAWLAKKCKNLHIVERNEEWLNKARNNAQDNNVFSIDYVFKPCNDGENKSEYYLDLPFHESVEFDIIINDDAYRTECCQMAVDYFKNRNKEGILISDNWIQSFVWISPKAEEIMQPFESIIFEQKDHTDNDGINKWKTAVHFIK